MVYIFKKTMSMKCNSQCDVSNGGSLDVSLSRPAWTAPTSALCSSPTSRCPTRARTCVSGATALVQIVLPLKSPCSKVRCRTESLRVAVLLVILLSSLDLIFFLGFIASLHHHIIINTQLDQLNTHTTDCKYIRCCFVPEHVWHCKNKLY